MDNEKIILFYDGTCGFCQKVIQLCNKWIADENVFYAPLQGETFKKLSVEHDISIINFDAIVLFKNKKTWIASEAFFKLAKHFKKPWYYLNVFSFLPIVLSNFFYNLIATNRYRISGEVDYCNLPDKKTSAKFLL